MSGINLLFENSVDYERTHQLALFILLKKSDLASYLIADLDKEFFDMDPDESVLWEPENRLFDLCVVSPKVRHYFEIKVWSELTENQLERQTRALEHNANRGHYILLGTSWFERTDVEIKEKSEGRSDKIGYSELIDSLSSVLANPKNSSDVCELAHSYHNVISSHCNKFTNGYLLPECDKKTEGDKKIFYYSLYRQIQQLFPNSISTSIYTVSNPAGAVYIMNNSCWRAATINGVNLQIYSEFESGKLRIKFTVDTDDNNVRLQVRDYLRTSIRQVLNNNFEICDIGRLGRHMTACQINEDFSRAERIQEAANAFVVVENSLDNIVEVFAHY